MNTKFDWYVVQNAEIFLIFPVLLFIFCDGLSSMSSLGLHDIKYSNKTADWECTCWNTKNSLSSKQYWKNRYKSDFSEVCENGIEELEVGKSRSSLITFVGINLLSFVDFEALKSGYYGKLLSARHEYTGQYFAIKITDVNPSREMELISRLSHENVINYENSWEEDSEDLKYAFPDSSNVYAIQMELCRGNDIASWIIDIPIWLKTETDAKKIIFQSLLGVEHIHSRGIAHRDLKPANILLKYPYTMNQTDLNVKIADFGSSVELSEIFSIKNITSTSLAGTPFYMSPEQERMESSYGLSTDIFSMGIIFYEVLMSSLTDSLEETLAEDLRIRKAIFPKVFVEKFPEENKIIKFMLSENPCQRPSATWIIRKLKTLWPNV